MGDYFKEFCVALETAARWHRWAWNPPAINQAHANRVRRIID